MTTMTYIELRRLSFFMLLLLWVVKVRARLCFKNHCNTNDPISKISSKKIVIEIEIVTSELIVNEK